MNKCFACRRPSIPLRVRYSCNAISTTRQRAQRHRNDRLPTRSVHVHQALHLDDPGRLFLADRPPHRRARGPVRRAELRQLRSVPNQDIQLPRGVRSPAARPVDIHLDEIQQRHLRTLPV